MLRGSTLSGGFHRQVSSGTGAFGNLVQQDFPGFIVEFLFAQRNFTNLLKFLETLKLTSADFLAENSGRSRDWLIYRLRCFLELGQVPEIFCENLSVLELFGENASGFAGLSMSEMEIDDEGDEGESEG